MTRQSADRLREDASRETAAGAPPTLDRLAPLTPNAWLRYDVIRRMFPHGVRDVLEIGCGEGALGVRLAKDYRYLGLEPDTESFAVAQQRFTLSGLSEVRSMPVEALDTEERFDLVCAFEVLEHIEDDAGALEAWSRRLRPGGWLLLSVPAHQRRYSAADEFVGHFRRYDQEPMAALLRRLGFTGIEMREYGMPLGYALEGVRKVFGRKWLQEEGAGTSMQERTGASGRQLQPRGTLQAGAARWGTIPFRYVQRAFPRTGTGMVVRARLAS